MKLLRRMLAFAVPILAQTPVIAPDGIFNNANYLPACATNGGVAQGALFAVFGQNLGPTGLVQASAFPLGTTLAGVSVHITAGAAGFDAIPLYVSSNQLGAILPGAVPAGDATVSVSYLGRASQTAPIRVRRNAFGIFTINQKGGGPAVVENVAPDGGTTLNASTRPLRPGQPGIIWGSGLGPVAGNESAGPLPGDQASLDTRVWIGDRTARVSYRGRSGCCAGIDQIVFETPSGIEGCQVPIAVEVAGVLSNFGSIAISSLGVCASSQRPPPVPSSSPNFSLGTILFLDGYGSVLLPNALEDYIRLAFFQKGRVDGDLEAPLRAFEPDAEVPIGSCAVRSGTDFPEQPSQPRQTPLDAGPELRVSGPGGVFRLLQSQRNAGNYEDAQRVVIPAGRYRIDNGAGGRDVGPFTIDADTITLRLTTSFDHVPRNQDLTVTWEYDGPPGQRLTLFGSSRGACGRDLISFSCLARAADKRFVIPARILSNLPPSTSFFGIPNGAFNISTTTPGGLKRFQAAGLELGVFLQIGISATRASFE